MNDTQLRESCLVKIEVFKNKFFSNTLFKELLKASKKVK